MDCILKVVFKSSSKRYRSRSMEVEQRQHRMFHGLTDFGGFILYVNPTSFPDYQPTTAPTLPYYPKNHGPRLPCEL